jgi:hypothetical protein
MHVVTAPGLFDPGAHVSVAGAASVSKSGDSVSISCEQLHERRVPAVQLAAIGPVPEGVYVVRVETRLTRPAGIPPNQGSGRGQRTKR